MRLGTLRVAAGTTAVRIDDDVAVEIAGAVDVGALLADPGWRARATHAAGDAHPMEAIAPTDWAPTVLAPAKIVCVGLNYASHIREMGRQLPEHPTLFAKYPEALIGPYDDLVLPPEAPDAVDWEGELAVVVGSTARRVAGEAARAAIAGYCVINDVTMRDLQYRTPQWLQGKTVEATTPLGPWLTTDLDLTGELTTAVDGEVVQRARLDDLVFGPAALVAYISSILTLRPGDVIATGTPGGVGHARKPPRYLRPGSTLTTSIEGIGAISSRVVAPGAVAEVAEA
ncbi:MAG TPA: fumarylacetoacetate hydrolase family protein [Cellulomonas sp.]|uniref:fumarylacetoacetate hydrolase family protein n=1 Tax=Cellulomonas sp. TaxID=40001 RepID=UPI002E3431C3|nr:fumarylacetoacetate hydrolase family protein [Cellulomonas sp.]HEX5332208.1 fumarylacetoacetate hydrolase family protein [Cellulomonas sp.]